MDVLSSTFADMIHSATIVVQNGVRCATSCVHLHKLPGHVCSYAKVGQQCLETNFSFAGVCDLIKLAWSNICKKIFLVPLQCVSRRLFQLSCPIRFSRSCYAYPRISLSSRSYFFNLSHWNINGRTDRNT